MILQDQVSDTDAVGSEEDAEGSEEALDSEDAEGSEDGEYEAAEDDGDLGSASLKGLTQQPARSRQSPTQNHPEYADHLPDSSSSSVMDMDVDAPDDDGMDNGIEYCSDEVIVQPHAEDCMGYEINPFASCVHPTSVNCLASTRNMRWLFSGGDDGFIRKFDFAATLNGEQGLTQTQKHGLVDSIEKGGVLSSVWENAEYPLTYDPTVRTGLDPENPPSLVAEWSPVYSLDVHPEGIWCVTGCKSGNINLWSVRHDEGHCQHVLREHRNAVSVLRLTPGERGLRWDLDVGKVVTRFQGVRSQITSLSFSPSPASSYPNLFDTADPKGTVAAFNNTDEKILAAVAAQQAAAAEDSMLMATSYDGAVLLFDQRVAGGIGRKFTAKLSEAPPWSLSACWSPNGDRIFCGRRNASVDEYDVREGRWVRSLRLPRDSGPVSFVACLPNSRHLLCASQDILRLWDLESSAAEPDTILTPMDVVPYDVTPASLQSDQSSATHSPPLIDSGTHMDMAGVDTSSTIDTTTVPNEDTDAFSTLTDGAVTGINGSTSTPNGTTTDDDSHSLNATPTPNNLALPQQSRLYQLRQNNGHSTASSANNTPRLPTAGLALFLHDEMQMNQDSVLGEELHHTNEDEDITAIASINNTITTTTLPGPAPPPPSNHVNGTTSSTSPSPTASAPLETTDPAIPPTLSRSSTHNSGVILLEPRRTNALAAQVTASLARRTHLSGASQLGPNKNNGSSSNAAPSPNRSARQRSTVGQGGLLQPNGVHRTNTMNTTTTAQLTKEDDFETAPLVPFTIVPGHNNGVVSTILIDPAKRYLITASGTRGWDGTASHLCLVYALVPVLSNNNNSNNNSLPATAPNPAAANTDASQPGMDVEESTDNNSGPAPMSTRPTVLVGDEDEEDDEDD
ncbi:hypothetical protein PhCBS80983_g06018 [Powellomyces hirtus]|uniref:Transcription factor spt8 beta-propeller domain-containing protein n=1 Tax=Powellomyces hirtus TaxID=109895 RepID=A0A507DSC3_9FUNG|nr:hypothetical protein PhCBS80983_g06018 [Powellomyces hirtus]